MKKIISTLLVLLAMSGLVSNCKQNNENDDNESVLVSLMLNSYLDSQKSVCEGRVVDSIQMFHSHTPDYGTYYIDIITAGSGSWNLAANQIEVPTSSGIRSVQTYKGYILFINSSGTSTQSLQIFENTNLSTPLASFDLDTVDGADDGDSPQDMVIVNNTAYIAISGSGVNDSKIAVIDISNMSSPSLITTITVNGNQPTNLACNNGYIYVANQDYNDKSQSTISIIDPATNTEATSVNVGDNTSGISFYGNKVYAYNHAFTADGNYSLTVFDAYTPGATLSTTTLSTFPDTGEKTVYGGSLVFNNSNAYILLAATQYSPERLLFNFDASTNTIGASALESNFYQWMGTNSTKYVRMHQGTTTTGDSYTVLTEDLNGNSLGSFQITKDTQGSSSALHLN